MKRTVLFDLDGTLIDSASRICAGLAAALRVLGRIPPPPAELQACIGLPLPHVWARLGLNSEVEIEAARAGYRAWAATADQSPVPAFPGIEALLARLHADGRLLIAASAKDTTAVRRTLAAQSWSHLFAHACGTEPGDGPDKRAVVARALTYAQGSAVMVGDMPVDLDAAAVNGIPAIAVTWGNAPRATLVALSPWRLVDDVDALGVALAET